MALSLTIRRLLTTQPIELQVFHPIALKLVTLLESPDFTMDEVIALASEDQSLAGSILRVANSAVYMGRVRTETIKEAVIRLGARQVSNLAMAASQSGLHVSTNPVLNRFMQSLWQHSHACAVGASVLAKTAGYAQFADQAYMAGLMHDVGKLYLLKAVEKLTGMGVAQAALEPDLLMEIFAELHVDQGMRVMEHWNMPKTYIDVVAQHHAENFDHSDTLLTVVRLVNTASKVRGIGLENNPAIDLFALPETDLLQLEQDELDEVLDAMEDSLEVQVHE